MTSYPTAIYKQNKQNLREAVDGEIESAIAQAIAMTEIRIPLKDMKKIVDNQGRITLTDPKYEGIEYVVRHAKNLDDADPREIRPEDIAACEEVFVIDGRIRCKINLARVPDPFEDETGPIIVIHSITDYSYLDEKQKPDKAMEKQRTKGLAAARAVKQAFGIGSISPYPSNRPSVMDIDFDAPGAEVAHRVFEIPDLRGDQVFRRALDYRLSSRRLQTGGIVQNNTCEL